MALTDKQVRDLNKMNVAAQRASLGTLLQELEGGGGGGGVTLAQVKQITDPIEANVSTLQRDLTSEVQARQSADTALGQRIDAIQPGLSSTEVRAITDPIDTKATDALTIANATNTKLDPQLATNGQYLGVTDNTSATGYGWVTGVSLQEFIALNNNLQTLTTAFTARTPVSGSWSPTWMTDGVEYSSLGSSYWIRTGRRVELFFEITVSSIENAIPAAARLGPLPFPPSTDALWYPAVVTYAEGFGSDVIGKNWAIHLRNDEGAFRVYITDNTTSESVYIRTNGINAGSTITGFAIYYTDSTEPTS